MGIFSYPTYIDAQTFSVSGDWMDDEDGFDIGRAVRCDCGADGVRIGFIKDRTYDGGFDETTVELSVASEDLTPNLEEVITSPIRPGPSGNVPNIDPRLVTVISEGDYDLTEDDFGKSFRMNVEVGNSFVLPSIAVGDDGKRIVFINVGSGSMIISSPDTTVVVGEVDSAAITTSGLSSICLEYVHVLGKWVAIAATGTWEDVT